MSHTRNRIITRTTNRRQWIINSVASLLTRINSIRLPRIRTVRRRLTILEYMRARRRPHRNTFTQATATSSTSPFTKFSTRASINRHQNVLTIMIRHRTISIRHTLRLHALRQPLFNITFLQRQRRHINTFRNRLHLLMANSRADSLPRQHRRTTTRRMHHSRHTSTRITNSSTMSPNSSHHRTKRLLSRRHTINHRHQRVTHITIRTNRNTINSFPFILTFTFDTTDLRHFRTTRNFSRWNLTFNTRTRALLRNITRARLSSRHRGSHSQGHRR